MDVRERLAAFPPARLAYRVRVGWHERAAMRRRPHEALRWLATGRELANFSYELANVDELAAFTARTAGAPGEDVRRLFAELDGDEELREALRRRLRTRAATRDSEPRYAGRRMWYALVRLQRPAAIGELGVHDGLGTAVLLRAVERNAAEGFPGRVLGFDVAPRAGWLVGPEQAHLLTHHAGDVRETLPRALAETPVQLTIHDTIKDYEHETFELETVLRHATAPVTVISRDASTSGALRALCERRGERYATFEERTRDHWWPGGEYGVAVLEP
ncbi:MAG TPA: class I SAM-dependent methyltransferase [Solirubrobacteraceae bacterium]|jgi:hypothetical protein|nr:class I SAM-dependent methyltransferase [Solirubrobacteraceae bacterium]